MKFLKVSLLIAAVVLFAAAGIRFTGDMYQAYVLLKPINGSGLLWSGLATSLGGLTWFARSQLRPI